MYRFFLLLLVPALASGCYHTRAVPAANLRGMERGNFGHELILQGTDGQRVRVDPRSTIRFLRTDGLWTAWVKGFDLRVNAEGAFHRGRPGETALAGLRWSQIHGIEVENLNGAKTYGVVVGATVLVACILVLILGSAKGGGGGGGGGKLFSGLGRGAGRAAGRAGRGLARGIGRAAHGVGHAMARGSYNLARAFSHGWRWYGPDIHVNISGPIEVPSGDPTSPPPEPPGAPPETGQPPAPVTPPGATPPQAAALYANRGSTVPLFSSWVRRQASLKLVGAVEGGGDLYYHDGGVFLGYAGLRFANVIELGGGAMLLRHRGTETVTPQELRSSWMGFGRFLLHFDIDQARHVALPFGVDAGAGHSRLHIRAVLGIRIRVWDQITLGLYPFNPSYTQFKDNDLKRSVGWWSFPTTAELSYAF